MAAEPHDHRDDGDGQPRAGQAHEGLALIDQARQRGAELTGLQRLLRGARESLLPLDRQGLALVRGKGVGAVGRLVSA